MRNDFLELLRRLTGAKVRFVVIGGFAATAYGCTLVTEDMDICCDFSTENLMRLQKALECIGPVHRMTPNRKPLELTPDNAVGLKNLYLETDLGVLDCIGSVSGVGDYQQTRKVSRQIETEGIVLNILNIEALIQSKTVLNRPRDQQAVIQLKAILELINKKDKPL